MPLLLPFLLAFIAGALAVLVFHQSALGLLHLVGLTSRTPFVLGSVPPLGVPQLLSLMFWGGVWGLALLPLAPGLCSSAGRSRVRCCSVRCSCAGCPWPYPASLY